MIDRLARGSLVLALLAGPAAAATAADTAAAGREANLKVTLVIGKSGGPAGDSQRVHRVLTRAGAPARFLMGWRTPIPTASSEAEAATNFVYQNVGVSATLDTLLLSDGTIRLSGDVEVSGQREGKGTEANRPPVIGTFQQRLDVTVRDGKRLRVAESPDPEGGTLYLEVEVAKLQD